MRLGNRRRGEKRLVISLLLVYIYISHSAERNSHNLISELTIKITVAIPIGGALSQAFLNHHKLVQNAECIN